MSKKTFFAGLACGIAIALASMAIAFAIGGYGLLNPKAVEEYAYLKDTYSFAEGLKGVLKDQFYEELTEEQKTAIVDGMYKGMVRGLDDPYSEYLTAEELERLMEQVNGSYYGVGITMSVSDDDFIEIISVADDSPAERAGFRTGDLVLAVDGVTYTGTQLSEAAENIRGEEGTEVTLTILRDEVLTEHTLVRKPLTDMTVYPDTLEGNIGYLRISNFETNTGRDFVRELEAMEQAGVSGLIIDLRNNGGGLVDSAIEVADQLMDAATVVYAENQQGERTYYKTENGRTDLPYVLLVDGGTASAAEILAAGVQEYGGGVVIGTGTYGKGVIQTTQVLINGGALKLTTMQYFTPSGEAIHGVGMSPDIEVKLSLDDLDENGYVIDRQLEKALGMFGQAE